MPTIISKLFVYGSLRSRRLRRRLLGREIKAVPATLLGFAKVSVTASPYPALVRAPTGETAGELLLGLKPKDLGRLDRYEGRQYRRIPCCVWVRGKPVSAWVYLWRDGRLPAVRTRCQREGEDCQSSRYALSAHRPPGGKLTASKGG